MILKKILFAFIIFIVFSLESFALKDRSLLRKLKKGTPYEKIIKDFGKPDLVLPIEKGRSCPEVVEYKIGDNTVMLYFYVGNVLCGLCELNSDRTIKNEIVPLEYNPLKNKNQKGAYKISPRQAEKILLKNGYEPVHGFSQLHYELFYVRDTHKNYKTEYKRATLIEDRIIYVFYFFEGEETNNYVCAHIFDEEYEDAKGSMITTFLKFDRNNDGVIEQEEGCWVTNNYCNLRPEGAAPNVWIPCDANGNGVLEENEGHWGWY